MLCAGLLGQRGRAGGERWPVRLLLGCVFEHCAVYLVTRHAASLTRRMNAFMRDSRPSHAALNDSLVSRFLANLLTCWLAKHIGS